jgi:exodeoxyribonuclease VII small subunit
MREGVGAPAPDDGNRTFEELLAELEAATDQLATGELGIEAATDLYERAQRLHAQATERLAQVRARVDRLSAEQVPGGGG